MSFGRVLRSEWIKFVTLRSNPPVFGVVVGGLAVMGTLPALAARADRVGIAQGQIAQRHHRLRRGGAMWARDVGLGRCAP